jgi:hypothetical protein
MVKRMFIPRTCLKNRVPAAMIAMAVIVAVAMSAACGEGEERIPTSTAMPTSIATVAQMATSTPMATAMPTRTPTRGTTHYSGEGVSFDYPEEWYQVGFNWEPGYEWGICFSGGVGDEPGVFVLRYDLGDETLAAFASRTREIGYGADYTVSPTVETTVGGRAAYTYTYAGTKDGTPVKGDTMIVGDGTSAWWLDAVATQAEYPENQAKFQMIFASFVIE